MPRAATAAAPKRGKAAKAKAAAPVIEPPVSQPAHAPFESALIALLDSAQHSFAAHTRSLTQAHDLYHSDAAQFAALLFRHVDRVMLVWKREAAVERLVDFVGKLLKTLIDTDTDSDSESLTLSLLARLVPYLSNSEKSVRFRACQLIALCLESLSDSDDASISDALANELIGGLIDRTKDKHPVIRAHAATALTRLQSTADTDNESGNDTDPIVECLLSLITSDTSVDVRRAAMLALSVESNTNDAVLLSFLSRVRDISPALRKLCYDILTSKFHLRQFNIQCRQFLLSYGLNDRDSGVKAACMRMLECWLEQCDENVVQLLELLGIEFMDKQKIESILGTIFENHLLKKAGKNTPQPPYGASVLTAANTLYWKCLVQYHQSSTNTDANSDSDDGDSNGVSEWMIDASTLCDTIAMHASSPFILTNLLEFSLAFELFDPVVHQSLLSLALSLLLDTDNGLLDEDTTVLKSLIALVKKLFSTSEENFIDFVHHRVIEQLKFHPTMLERSLNVIIQCLSGVYSVDINNNQWLCEWKEQLIEPLLLTSDHSISDNVRALSLKSLGLLALLDRQLAERYWPALIQAVKVESVSLQLIAVQAIIDIGLMFDGLAQTYISDDASHDSDEDSDCGDDEPVNKAELAELSLTESLLGFGQYLYDSNDSEAVPELTELCVSSIEGLCKLLLHSRIAPHRHHLSAILMLVFDSRVQQHTQLMQCLAVFLPAFAAVNTDRHLPAMVEGMIGTCTAIVYAKESEHYPALSIIINYCYFTVQHVRGAKVALTKAWLYYLLAFPKSKLLKSVTASIANIDYTSGSDSGECYELHLLCDELIDSIDDKVSIKHIDKLKSRLLAVIKAAAHTDSDNETEQEFELPSLSEDELRQFHDTKTDRILHAQSLDVSGAEAEHEDAVTSNRQRAQSRKVRYASSDSESEGDDYYYGEDDSDGDIEIIDKSPSMATAPARQTHQRQSKSQAAAKLEMSTAIANRNSTNDDDVNHDSESGDENAVSMGKDDEVEGGSESGSDDGSDYENYKPNKPAPSSTNSRSRAKARA